MISLHDRYAKRLAQLGADYRWIDVPDTPAGKRYSEAHAREREAAALEAKIPARYRRIALDPRGKSLDSPGLADALTRWCQPGAALLIGGPTGLEATLRDRCDVRWSLSPLTFPHEMVRVIVTEQLYRAVSLSRGLPYHK